MNFVTFNPTLKCEIVKSMKQQFKSLHCKIFRREGFDFLQDLSVCDQSPGQYCKKAKNNYVVGDKGFLSITVVCILCFAKSKDKPECLLLLDIFGYLSCQSGRFSMLRIHPYTSYFILNCYLSTGNMKLSTLAQTILIQRVTSHCYYCGYNQTMQKTPYLICMLIPGLFSSELFLNCAEK